MASKTEVQGVVVSDKMQKSVVVAVERRVQHAVYSKIQKRTTTFLAHNENDDAKIGDTVTETARRTSTPFPGFREMKPMVFAGLYPTESHAYAELREALEKLRLSTRLAGNAAAGEQARAYALAAETLAQSRSAATLSSTSGAGPEPVLSAAESTSTSPSSTIASIPWCCRASAVAVPPMPPPTMMIFMVVAAPVGSVTDTGLSRCECLPELQTGCGGDAAGATNRRGVAGVRY